MVENLLKKCEEWRYGACSLLKDAEDVFNVRIIRSEMIKDLILKMDQLISSTEGLKVADLSLGFDFHEMPKLEDAFLTLKWC